jgi:hypothetical protein
VIFPGVVPANAEIHRRFLVEAAWIPAFAGMAAGKRDVTRKCIATFGLGPMSATDIAVTSFIVPNAQRCQSEACGDVDNVRHLALSSSPV